MATLNAAARAAVLSKVSQDLSQVREPCGILKSELKAAVDAIDDWVDANAGAFNSAIPQPARSSLTSQQKARILAYVVAKRWEVA